MNKTLKRILSVLLVIIISLGLTACDGFFEFGDGTIWDTSENKEDKQDSSGSESKTPYEEAVQNGYRGSYTEWLVELFTTEEYKSIYDTMVEEGTFTGTLTEFVEMLKGETGSSDIQEASSIGLRSAVTIFSTATDISKLSDDESASGSAGSGVIFKEELSNDGSRTGVCYVITNFHVCYGQETYTRDYWGRQKTSETKIYDNIYVNFYGMPLRKQMVKAEYIGGSATYDIAVLKVTSDLYKNCPVIVPCSLGDSNKILVGDKVIAVGNPEGDGISVTSGIVSVPLETITMSRADNNESTEFKVIRIDAAVNGGNSGGGLYDDQGKLIGIVNAKTVNEEIEGICYALPINFSVAIANRILTMCNGSTVLTISKPRLGIWTSVTDSKPVYDTETKSVSTVYTISVHEVGSDGICVGKLEAGDKLISITFKGKTYPIISQFSIEEVLLLAYPGETITLNVLRTTENVESSIDVDITLTDTSITEVA